MSDHSDDYDMQINGQVDGLVGADDTPPVDSKGAAIDEIRVKYVGQLDNGDRVTEEIPLDEEAKQAILALLAQEVNNIHALYLSDISWAVGILEGLGHPDEYLNKQRTKLLGRLG